MNNNRQKYYQEEKMDKIAVLIPCYNEGKTCGCHTDTNLLLSFLFLYFFKLINIIPIQTKITPTIFVLFNVSLKIKNAAKSTITFTNPPNTL